METSGEKEVISTNGLKRVLLVNLVVLFCLGFVGPFMLAFDIFRTSEELELPSKGSVVFPVLKTFCIGLLTSLVIGKWATSRLVAHYKNQHLSQGVVLNNNDSIFAHFGLNLVFGAFIGVSFFEAFICHIPLTEDVSGSLTAIFSCKTVFNSVIALVVGIVMGLGLWVIYQGASIEKETNQTIMVQFYSTRQWSLLGIAGIAAAIFIVGLMFYKIFTLGQS